MSDQQNEAKPPSEGVINHPILELTDDKSEADVPANLCTNVRRKFLQKMMKTIPKPVQDRIGVLKNLQLDQMKKHAEFCKEIFALEKKYYEVYKPLIEKRAAIINGDIDPPAEEPKYKIDKIEDNGENKDFSHMLEEVKNIPADAKGVPGFWLAVFKNVECFAEMIKPRDVDALKKLKDVKYVYEEKNSCTIQFVFEKNEFFTNSMLTKKYYISADFKNCKCTWDYVGLNIWKCIGCEIDWLPDKNLTIETEDKTGDSDGKSFFTFFMPEIMIEGKEDIEKAEYLQYDYDMGQYLREFIIPKAVALFTGDLLEESDEEDSDEGSNSSWTDDDSAGSE